MRRSQRSPPGVLTSSRCARRSKKQPVAEHSVFIRRQNCRRNRGQRTNNSAPGATVTFTTHCGHPLGASPGPAGRPEGGPPARRGSIPSQPGATSLAPPVAGPARCRPRAGWASSVLPSVYSAAIGHAGGVHAAACGQPPARAPRRNLLGRCSAMRPVMWNAILGGEPMGELREERRRLRVSQSPARSKTLGPRAMIWSQP